MAKKTNRTLSLKKETLRRLDTLSDGELAAVGGGAYASGKYCGSGGGGGATDGTTGATDFCNTYDGRDIIISR